MKVYLQHAWKNILFAVYFLWKASTVSDLHSMCLADVVTNTLEKFSKPKHLELLCQSRFTTANIYNNNTFS